ncbi:MAG TPA: hypothetical protein VEA15_08725 [Caulobacteraceae bacterium]|nr:hypothetical protein [Caulobacteraceae bacterium]
MWLTTPRFLAGVALLAAATLFVAWLEGRGGLTHDQARLFYAGAALVVLAAIVYRARARWRAWRDRQP